MESNGHKVSGADPILERCEEIIAEFSDALRTEVYRMYQSGMCDKAAYSIKIRATIQEIPKRVQGGEL